MHSGVWNTVHDYEYCSLHVLCAIFRLHYDKPKSKALCSCAHGGLPLVSCISRAPDNGNTVVLTASTEWIQRAQDDNSRSLSQRTKIFAPTEAVDQDHLCHYHVSAGLFATHCPSISEMTASGIAETASPEDSR